MFSACHKVRSLLQTMLVTGIILAPASLATAALATPAVQDLVDLRVVINAAANSIGAENNPNKGWGFGLLGGGSGQLGTADLINNITTTILRSKWQLDTNKTSWLRPTNVSNVTDLNNTTWTPTLPLTSSMALPSAVPTTTPALDNIATDLSTPYIDYVSSIPNLSTSLTSLGRSYHREMNAPVHEAIDGLQQSLSTLQSTMLQNNLISSQAVIRTIRASSSLEDCQQAWSRFLNLPGGGGDKGTASSDGDSSGPKKRALRSTDISAFQGKAERLLPAEGRYYTHKELWGRDAPRARQSEERKAKSYNAVVQWEEQREKTVENARVGWRYVA